MHYLKKYAMEFQFPLFKTNSFYPYIGKPLSGSAYKTIYGMYYDILIIDAMVNVKYLSLSMADDP